MRKWYICGSDTHHTRPNNQKNSIRGFFGPVRMMCAVFAVASWLLPLRPICLRASREMLEKRSSDVTPLVATR
jgi:hypothetical protein